MSDLPFTDAATRALQASIALAKDNSNSVVSPLHLASALLNPAVADGPPGTTQTQNQGQATLLHSILNKAGGDPTVVQRNLAKLIVRLPAQDPAPDDVGLSPALSKILQQSKRLMSEKNDSFIAVDHLVSRTPVQLLRLIAHRLGCRSSP